MYRCMGPLGTLLLNVYMLICGEHEGNAYNLILLKIISTFCAGLKTK